MFRMYFSLYVSKNGLEKENRSFHFKRVVKEIDTGITDGVYEVDNEEGNNGK